MGLIDFLQDQGRISRTQDWADQQSQSGNLDPNIASLIKANPDFGDKLLPLLAQHNLEQSAINKAYGIQKQAPLGTAASGDPTQLLDQMLGQQQQLTPLQKLMSNFSQLPGDLQKTIGTQIASGMIGDGSGVSGGLDNIAASIAAYKSKPLTAMQLKTPAGLALQEKVLEQNPDYDVTKFPARQKVTNDMTPGGTLGKQKTAIVTAFNHYADLVKASDEIGGIDTGVSIIDKPLNYLYNAAKSSSGANRTYDSLQKFAGDETAKALSGANGSTKDDRNDIHDLLSKNFGPTSRRVAAQKQAQALISKLEPMADAYNKAYNENRTPVEMLSKQSQQALIDLGIQLPEGLRSYEDGANQTSAIPETAAQSAASQITPELARAELARRKARNAP